MPAIDRTILAWLGEVKPSGKLRDRPFSWFSDETKERVIRDLGEVLGTTVDSDRADVDIASSTSRLKTSGLIDAVRNDKGPGSSTYSFRFTSKGYAALDEIKSNFSPS